MLEKYVAEWAANSGLPVQIKIFSSAEAFRFAWEEEKDWWLILLDIQMQGENGVSLAKYCLLYTSSAFIFRFQLLHINQYICKVIYSLDFRVAQFFI